MKDALVIGLIVFAAACWICSVANLIRMVLHRKPELPLRPSPLEKPLNYIFRPESLTEMGLRARTWVFVGAAGFGLCILTLLVLAGLGVLESH